jgi:hypothetical protein
MTIEVEAEDPPSLIHKLTLFSSTTSSPFLPDAEDFPIVKSIRDMLLADPTIAANLHGLIQDKHSMVVTSAHAIEMYNLVTQLKTQLIGSQIQVNISPTRLPLLTQLIIYFRAMFRPYNCITFSRPSIFQQVGCMLLKTLLRR